MRGPDTAPRLGRVPALHGLHVVTRRVFVVFIAELHTYQLEPRGLLARRGDVDLAAVEPDIEPALFDGDPELFGILVAHARQGVAEPGGITAGAGAAACICIAGGLGAFFGLAGGL